MSTVIHSGPIERYEVRDESTGERFAFSSFDLADEKYTELSKRPGHIVEFIAVICE